MKRNNVTPTLIESPGGWVDLLVKARRYDSSRDAKARIILTAAYPELLLNKALRLSPNELDDDEYKYLNGVVGKYVPGRMISLENVIRSEQQMETVRVVFGVETLRKRLDKELICTAREVLLKDLAEKYNRCRQELLSLSKEAVRSQQELLTASRMGNETLQEKMNQAETGTMAPGADKRNAIKEKTNEIICQAQEEFNAKLEKEMLELYDNLGGRLDSELKDKQQKLERESSDLAGLQEDFQKGNMDLSQHEDQLKVLCTVNGCLEAILQNA